MRRKLRTIKDVEIAAKNIAIMFLKAENKILREELEKKQQKKSGLTEGDFEFLRTHGVNDGEWTEVDVK